MSSGGNCYYWKCQYNNVLPKDKKVQTRVRRKPRKMIRSLPINSMTIIYWFISVLKCHGRQGVPQSTQVRIGR